MKFLSNLFGSRDDIEELQSSMSLEDIRQQATALQNDVPLTPLAEPEAGPEAEASEVVNIWEMDDDDAPASAAPAASPAPNRRRRNATRLIGFDTSEGDVVDLFDQSSAVSSAATSQFPAGWLLVVEGEGRGHCFTLHTGMNQIGRGEDNTIQLDFGDTAISRNNHAAVVFDDQEGKFLLGHGGKSNIVRLNGKPVISNEDLVDGDRFKVGETTLLLKTLCGADFNWSDAGPGDGEEQDDVAIA